MLDTRSAVIVESCAMRNLGLLTVTFALCVAPLAFSSAAADRKAVALAAPRPEYPPYAKEHGLTGAGWYIMNVDAKTGRVLSVQIAQSSGHKILDNAAVRAFLRWRLKPNTIQKIRCPVRWTLNGAQY